LKERGRQNTRHSFKKVSAKVSAPDDLLAQMVLAERNFLEKLKE
jgi:hypothetical protein